MGLLMTDEPAVFPDIEQIKYVWKPVCSRCDLRLVDVVVVDGKAFCYDCSAIVRRGASVVVNYDDHAKDKTINDLILACESALLLRGLTAAINDPMALFSEKQTFRRRYIEIERQIFGAIENAKELKK